MRVIIVDDEVTSSQVLEQLLREYVPSVQIISICNKAKDSIQILSELKPDLVFLDIEMPGITGFDILDRLEEIHFDVIFTTAHSQYGIRAIQFSAIDYLLKPIDVNELIQSVQRAENNRTNKYSIERIKVLLENIQQMNHNAIYQRIALPISDGFKFIFTDDIIRCASSNNYTNIYLKNGEKILVSRTLKDFENNLNVYPFCRVHNSHLINVKYVQEFVKTDSSILVMTDGTEVEVSRRKKDELIRMLNPF